MDLMSTLIGFLVGTATGAAGSYYATKFTEQRQRKESKLEFKTTLSNLEIKMPDLFKEFREDLSDPDNDLKREFYILNKSNVLNIKGTYLAYYNDDYSNLKDMINLLESESLISDITELNVPKYQFNNEFVVYLKNEI